MNYRHAFHAGNFADVMKHVLLARMLTHLGRKPAPFFVLDTHGGLGLYDLAADEASRTGEWLRGVALMEAPFADEVEALLAPWRAALAATRRRHGETAYPGSPMIVGELLRPGDRALAVELHPADFGALKRALVPVPGVRALHLDGWTALHANIPPKERRGLVLVDPPYEKTGELTRAVDEMTRALRKWSTGVFALWYPVKDRRPVDAAARRLKDSGLKKLLRLELYLDPDGPPDRLNGCGLFIANPPWKLDEEAALLLPALAARLAPDGRGGVVSAWIAGE
ncbi:23S rRNA (adenine(2030)-N(6))-methyltransferase RlmJ [Camelimonas abortus]|uniref:Ribosomal RNA large subunit methyltransferase J n=1 Tax=Camelimonas abortus TaxID=1017184 RepID=A0ABV7LC27_9HYPH